MGSVCHNLKTMNLIKICSETTPGVVRQKKSYFKTNLFRVFVLAFMLILGAQSPALAQTPTIHWTNLDSFKVGYQFATNDTLLLPNQHFAVKLYLKAYSSHPCLGSSFDLLFSNQVALDSDSNFSKLPQVWLGYDYELSASSDSLSTTQADLEVSRMDTQENYGNGWVLNANFVVGSTAIETEKVILTLGGGLIMLDNMDMKRAPSRPEPEDKISIYPNPTQDRIWLKGPNPENWKVKVRDWQGNLMLETQADFSRMISLEGLDPGVWLVELTNDLENQRKFFRIVKQ